ncbi:MAG: DUF6069 family protein [Acidimicrobiales bacterium]
MPAEPTAPPPVTGHPIADRFLRLARVDGIGSGAPHRGPRRVRFVAASIASVVGSLIACAVLVADGEALFPPIGGFVQFRLYDYGSLTVAGVIVACAAWPIVVRVSSDPRWLFFRLAIFVTLFLFLPDLYILARGASPAAVSVLMTMHLAVALITYNLLVRVAPPRRSRRTRQVPHSLV